MWSPFWTVYRICNHKWFRRRNSHLATPLRPGISPARRWHCTKRAQKGPGPSARAQSCDSRNAVRRGSRMPVAMGPFSGGRELEKGSKSNSPLMRNADSTRPPTRTQKTYAKREFLLSVSVQYQFDSHQYQFNVGLGSQLLETKIRIHRTIKPRRTV